ncbi:MAG TPA: PhzF family phenazine biosynthesis protein [Chthoniobacterales bacterium]
MANKDGRTFDFVQVDVFTQTPLAGNALAVFPDARGLSDDEMQALAKEMNLSETTFILPRDAATEAKEGKKVRIFTVSEELPFAGHPTLGTALYLHSAAGKTASNEIVLDLKVGKIPVCVDQSPERSGRVDGKSFGEMRQRDPEFGQILERKDVARAVGVNMDEIAADWPSQVVSTGLPFAIVPIRDFKALEKLRAGFSADDLLRGTGAKFIYFLSTQRGKDGLEARARMFFYGGEDPATGSAAGCAASWMAKHGVAKSDERVVIHQGVEMKRPSEIFVRAAREGDRVTNVRVGGYAVEILRGTVTL